MFLTINRHFNKYLIPMPLVFRWSKFNDDGARGCAYISISMGLCDFMSGTFHCDRSFQFQSPITADVDAAFMLRFPETGT